MLNDCDDVLRDDLVHMFSLLHVFSFRSATRSGQEERKKNGSYSCEDLELSLQF
jgi:hypothetical protein